MFDKYKYLSYKFNKTCVEKKKQDVNTIFWKIKLGCSFNFIQFQVTDDSTK